MSTTILSRIANRTLPVQNLDGRAIATPSIGRTNCSEEQSVPPQSHLSGECFRSVWTHSIDGMRLTDGAGRIVDVNTAYCELVAVPRQKLLGELFTVTHEEKLRAEAIGSYQQRFESGILAAHTATRLRLWNSEERELEISNSF